MPPTPTMCSAGRGAMSSFLRRWALPPPALVLFFLAPAIGELLSASAPPAEFFNPFMLILLSVLYGGGAILIREATLRWCKGWPTLLLLGAAYGIVEEGLMVKSFFDPNWVDLGDSAGYARWHGVNWHWSINLTLYRLQEILDGDLEELVETLAASAAEERQATEGGTDAEKASS